MILLSHPLGNANVRQAALALAEACVLGEFWTGIAPNASLVGRFFRHLPGAGDLKRRDVPSAVVPFTRQHPVRESLRLLASKFGWSRLLTHESGFASVDAVYRSLDEHVAHFLDQQRGRIEGVYAYEDGALQSFRAARRQGMKTIYDLPIGYWRASRKIAEEEAERLPDWSVTLPGLRDSHSKLERKDEELRLADTVVVASQFTARTLKNAPFPISSLLVVPYGCAEEQRREFGSEGLTRQKSEPLRVLFVGSLTQRKGVYELFRAVDALGKQVHLTLVGGRVAECLACDRLLGRHTWIPSLPHHEILGLMRNQDVLVFPSLFEGFGLVITEALSQGLPVITTPHTGGPDVLTAGLDGFLVPIRNWEAIAERLEELARDRDKLAAMKLAASATARKRTWENYRQNLIAALKPLLAAN